MSWKRKIRPAIDRAGKYSGLLWAGEQLMRSKLTILMYHRVLGDRDCVDYPFPSLVMPSSLFDTQLAYLSEHARVLPVSEALLEGPGSTSDSKPLACLSFDDGYIDNFEIAAPLLEARGLRGTFYITAGAVQSQTPLWYDRAAAKWASLGIREIRARVARLGEADVPELGTRNSWIEWLKTIPDERRKAIMTALETQDDPATSVLMTPDQVQQLAERGHEIGSHTLSHPILSSMAPDQRRAEIVGARQLLRDWTNREVPGFCYPNGDFNSEVIGQLREAGHSYACTTLPGRNDQATDPFRLRRIDVTVDRVTGADGRFDLLGFRTEISLLREGLRRMGRLRGPGARR